MYSLARHWVRGTGFVPSLDIETDLLSVDGALVAAAAAAAAGIRFETDFILLLAGDNEHN
jgi:hypothetical protein